MDAVWTALDGARASRHSEFKDSSSEKYKKNKFLDWLTM